MFETTLSQARMMALKFLEQNEPHCIGIIDTDEKMAAGIIFIDMERDGLLLSVRTAQWPFYSLTDLGRRALTANTGAPDGE